MTYPTPGFNAIGGISGPRPATVEAAELRTNVPQVNSTEEQVRPATGSDKGALFLDAEGNIVTAQPVCAGYFGRSPEELVGLNIHALLKPSFGKEITEALTKGRGAGKISLDVFAVRNDGSEFATQLTFKFLPNNPGFCWIMFVQAPADSDGGSPQEIMNLQVNSKSGPDRELQQITATTETATESAQPEAEEIPSTQPAPLSNSLPETERLAAKLDAARAECERLARIKFEADTAADKRLTQVQSEYGRRIMQLEEDLMRERQSSEKIKQELSKPRTALEKTNAEFQELQQKYQSLESETAAIRQEREQLQAILETQIEMLTARLEQASRAMADLEEERAAGKLWQQKAEDLSVQVEQLRNAAEQAELRARESAAQSKEWEEKAADQQKAIDELNRVRVDEQGASGQSAERLKELELQLQGANDNLAASRADLEEQNSARQRLEAEIRELTEAKTKARVDLDKERDTNNVSRQETEKLAAQSKEWEKKAADQKKAFDDLNRTRVNEQYASWQSAQRLKELELQLKSANDNLAAGKTKVEEQNSARQKLESENRSLTEANAKAKADLDKERDSNNISRRETEKLAAQLKKLQHGAEEAELRAREKAAQLKDWEKKAADQQKAIDELNRIRVNEQNAGAQSAQRLKEVELQLQGANNNLAASRADLEKQNSARQKLETENRNLREANAQAKADLEKTIDEITRSRDAAQNASAQSLQRLKELEQKLKLAKDELAASKTKVEEQNSARQKLESEKRSLTEANAKAKADLDKERDTNNISRQETEKLAAQLKKLQHGAEAAELRARENAAQLKDWEKKAADQKKAIDELNRIRVNEQGANAQSAQRLKELELQFQGANNNLAASRADLEKQNSARQRLETENRNLRGANAQTKADLEKTVDEITRSRDAAQNASAQSLERLKELEQQLKGANDSLAASRAETKKQDSTRQRLESANQSLTEANAKTRADLDKEREANKLSRQTAQGLNTELKKSQRAVEQAEARLRKSAAQCSDREEKVAELKKANSRLEKESAKGRRQLKESLAKAQRQLERQSTQGTAEITKLRAALERGESQRKKLEDELLRLREIIAQHEQGTMVDSLRQGLRERVEELRQSASGLLKIKLPVEERRLAETILGHALSLKVFLNANG